MNNKNYIECLRTLLCDKFVIDGNIFYKYKTIFFKESTNGYIISLSSKKFQNSL